MLNIFHVHSILNINLDKTTCLGKLKWAHSVSNNLYLNGLKEFKLWTVTFSVIINKILEITIYRHKKINI